MASDPARRLVEDLGAHLSGNKYSDIILNSGSGKRFALVPSNFSEIRPVDSPCKIAFVDGGNYLLDESPNYRIVLNRVYYSLFQGRTRIPPKNNPRLQFYSSVIPVIRNGADGGDTNNDAGSVPSRVGYHTKLFTYSEHDMERLPDELDLTSDAIRQLTLQSDYLDSLGRRFAEWQLAIRAVESELERGDILVMDGSLQTNFQNEFKYADRLYDIASKKGVIVCGLAKTSRLITESGHPLLARIAEIARDVAYPTWYIKVAEKASPDERGFILAVKLHQASRFIFRFEILHEQFYDMSPDKLNSVLASLTANSQDAAMLGYPYGAIDADRFAQVRSDEFNMYRDVIRSEMLMRPERNIFQRYSASLRMHDHLNGVTS